MTNEDLEQFADLVTGVYQVYGLSIGSEGLAFWQQQLADYSLADVQSAFRRYTCDGGRTQRPTPNDILLLLRRRRVTEDSKTGRKAVKRASPESAKRFVDDVLSRLGGRRDTADVPKRQTPLRVEPQRRQELLKQLEQFGVSVPKTEVQR